VRFAEVPMTAQCTDHGRVDSRTGGTVSQTARALSWWNTYCVCYDGDVVAKTRTPVPGYHRCSCYS
jgi:hypothetical protein